MTELISSQRANTSRPCTRRTHVRKAKRVTAQRSPLQKTPSDKREIQLPSNSLRVNVEDLVAFKCHMRKPCAACSICSSPKSLAMTRSGTPAGSGFDVQQFLQPDAPALMHYLTPLWLTRAIVGWAAPTNPPPHAQRPPLEPRLNVLLRGRHGISSVTPHIPAGHRGVTRYVQSDSSQIPIHARGRSCAVRGIAVSGFSEARD